MDTDALFKKHLAPVGANETDASTYFECVLTAFQRAGASGRGFIDRFYMIGGSVIRLRFAGAKLIRHITPAFEHLAIDPVATPALTICLWDTASTHIKPPLPFWKMRDLIHQYEGQECLVNGPAIIHFKDKGVHGVFQPEGNILNLLHATRNVATFWVFDADQLPYYESGAPLRMILHAFFRNQGLQFVHAAAVGTSKGGVLLVGKGGAGKSTTTLACVQESLLYVGDDYVLISTKTVPFVHSLYNSAKLALPHVKEKLPHLLPLLANSERLSEEKALFFLHNLYRDQVVAGLRIRAILVPCVTGVVGSQLIRTSASTSLKALAPSTIFQLPGTGHETFKYLSHFVRQIPSYILEIGSDLSTISPLISQLLLEA